MKQVLFYIAAMAAMTACSDAAVEPITPEMDGGKSVTLSVDAPEAIYSRVAIDEDWAVAWEAGDRLLAVGMTNGVTQKFTIEESKSYTASASFTGTTPSTADYNLIYPYSAGSKIYDGTKLPLELTTQDAGAKSTYMISQRGVANDAIAPSVKMMNLGTVVELNMIFDEAYRGAAIERVEIGGMNSKMELDLSYAFIDADMVISVTNGTITLNNVDAVGADGTLTTRFNAFQTTIYQGDHLDVTAYLASGEAINQIITLEKKTIFACATYTTIDCDFTDINYGDGDGSSTKPYQISTPTQLAKLATDVNSGESYDNKYFKLTSDIDLSGLNWVAIGGCSRNKFTSTFDGTFDGGGHKVTGLNIDTNSDYQALFGYIYGATVKNLSVSGSVKSSFPQGYIGGVVGYANDLSTVANCSYSGSVEGADESAAGGVVGCADSYSDVVNCYNSGSVEGGDFSSTGGVVGQALNHVTVNNCYNVGSVRVGDDAYIGGVVGEKDNGGAIIRCYYQTGTAPKGADGGDLSATEVSGLDAAYMQGAAYTKSLNDNAGLLNKESNTACGWRAGSENYPTHNYTTYPPYTLQ